MCMLAEVLIRKHAVQRTGMVDTQLADIGRLAIVKQALLAR